MDLSPDFTPTFRWQAPTLDRATGKYVTEIVSVG
jgi:hypothetical protein